MKYILLMILVMLMAGCARYKVTIQGEHGPSTLSIWSMREFPKGMKTEYKDFSFEANAVSNSLDVGAIRDIVELGITGKNGEE